MLTIPEHAKIIELPTSTIWFDDTGILCAISKKAKAPTLEESMKSMAEFRQKIGSEKVCMLIDVTHSTETSREVRTYAAEELPKIVKAIAMVSSSALGKMVANLFFNLKSQPYPVKMFNDVTEAKVWLKNFL
jgi:microsomal dipeptidase-like Zn-dependent dipeptidase